MTTIYEKLPKCGGGCKNTEPFTSKAGKEYVKCLDCKNLVFDDTKRAGAFGREKTTTAETPRQAPYTDPATLKLLAVVEKMAVQLEELHNKLN